MTTNIIQPMLGEKIVVLVGDGATPTEVFTAASVINTTRALEFVTAFEEDDLIDLNDPSAPAQKFRRPKSSDCKIDGAGTIHKPDLHTWLTWSKEGSTKNLKITTETSLITGPFVLTSFQVDGDHAKTTTCKLTLQQAGPVTLTENI